MKKDWQALTAKKYAQAFLGVFKDRLSFDDICTMEFAYQFLTKHKRALFFLRLPLLDVEIKRKALCAVCERFDLPVSIQKLIDLLLQHKRSFLINDILYYIAVLYKKEQGILTVTISSSQALSERETEVIKGFLAQETGCDIIYKYKEDKKLIAGVRLQSNTFLWEFSVAKRLHAMRLLLIR